MKVFITYGTYDYLKKMKDSHEAETLVLMQREEDQYALVHETENESIFKEGHDYEVIDQAGDIEKGAYAVLNNIPVSDEGRPLFEYRFNQRAGLIEKEPGFAAIRVLRPLKSNTYIILTVWESQQDFKNWQNSKAFDNAHKKREETNEPSKQKNIFSGPSYVTSYQIIND